MGRDATRTRERGVVDDPLTESERASLDRDGFLVLRDVVEPKALRRLRDAFERAIAADVASKRLPTERPETGTRHVGELLDRDEAFVEVALAPRVLAAAHHLLRREFAFGGLHGRDPLPGFGAQTLHRDWTAKREGDPVPVVTVLWLLDDYSADNGATRVVPGSHRRVTPLDPSFSDPSRRHPREQRVVAPAGSALLFDGHLLHSGTRNESASESRRVLQGQYVGVELRHRIFGNPPQIPPACLAALAPAARRMFGVGE
jgi:ectoine hydroxylase-related dioxygenase (phytanoyl-CoA dioxygenase family)